MRLSHLIYTVRPCLIHTSHFYELDTAALCKSNGKAHSKPLAARHGRGTAWARQGICESALRLYNIFFFTLPHKRHDIEKKIKGNWICVLNFSTISFETFLILIRTERDMTTNVYWSSCKVPVVLVVFKWKLNPLDGFSKNTQVPNFIKIWLVGADLFHVDGWTDKRTDRRNEAK
jgi:hypothetical protein